jgi:cytochrome c oxidase assembly protein subunit 15
VSATSWFARPPAPGLALQRVFAIAGVIAQTGIAVTGSVVRVTGSGLGCPTWPQCFSGSMVPVDHPDVASLHQWVEFSNRMLAIMVGVTTALVLLSALLSRPRRRRVLVLALTMPLGVLAQGVIGGITVLTGLVWWTVAAHFLASMPLVWLSVLLVRAVGEGDQPARPLVPAALRTGLLALAAVLTGLLVAGTLVTAAGPHAGDARTPRLDVPVATLAQLHADLLFLFLGMLVTLGFALRGVRAPARVWRGYWILVAVVLAQGALGMVQYWTGVPEVLVSLHVLGAGLVTIATAALWTATRDRGPLPRPVSVAAESVVEPATAVS